jgi:CRP-like cAMP-binding protein
VEYDPFIEKTDSDHRNFLRDLSEKQRDDIISRGRYRHVPSGGIVFRQDDPATRCFLVVEGRLKLTKLHESGKEVLIRYIGPGELTAMIVVLEKRTYPVSAEAVGDTRVVEWSKREIMELISHYPQLCFTMLCHSLERLEELQRRHLELFAEQVEQRIARSLLRIMRQAGERSGDAVIITFPISRQELADYTGTTLYTVSRTLSAWEKKGWIKSKREQIIITDPHALVLFSEKI